jgi:hypothetical protein
MPEYIDTLISDGVRIEANNKLTILGLLGDAIFVPQIPILLASLAILQRWKPSQGEAPGRAFSFSFEIHGPEQMPPIVVPSQNVIVPDGPRPTLNFMVQMQAFAIPHEGDYEVRTFVDGRNRKTYTFFIGVPSANRRSQLSGFNP